jgi:hypothetical protein
MAQFASQRAGLVQPDPPLGSRTGAACSKAGQGQRFAIISNQSDTPWPDETDEEWQLWLAGPWKRAKFAAGRGGVDVVFHEST